MELSVVVPCYNEEEVILALYDRIAKITESLEKSYEIIFVNDGSKDNTWNLILKIAHNDPNVVGISLTRNHGHQLALSAGLHISKGERIFIIDADLQDPPELLPEMMLLMDKGADIVYGKRIKRHGESIFKKFTASLFYRILNLLTDVDIPVDTGDFRLISRRVLEILNSMPEHHRFIRGMVSWTGFKQVPLNYERDERFAGVTKYPINKMIRFAFDAITSFSIRPLKLASTLGIFFAFLGFFGLSYAFISWLTGNTIAGWTSVIISSLILGSTQLIVLGIIGEYLGRLYIETKRRPLFNIDRIISNKTENLMTLNFLSHYSADSNNHDIDYPS